jgi:hypothetical protein
LDAFEEAHHSAGAEAVCDVLRNKEPPAQQSLQQSQVKAATVYYKDTGWIIITSLLVCILFSIVIKQLFS